MRKTTLLVLAALASMDMAAQYPTIPDSVKARAAQWEAQWEAASDKAWAEAYPIVMKEEAELWPVPTVRGHRNLKI